MCLGKWGSTFVVEQSFQTTTVWHEWLRYNVTPKVILWMSEVLLNPRIFPNIPILFYDVHFTCVKTLKIMENNKQPFVHNGIASLGAMFESAVFSMKWSQAQFSSCYLLASFRAVRAEPEKTPDYKMICSLDNPNWNRASRPSGLLAHLTTQKKKWIPG